MNDPLARRPDGVSDETVEAIGKLTDALESVERARGHIYALHQLVGRADNLFTEAAEAFEKAGHTDWAQRVRDEMSPINVLEGRWTFQIVEEFDDGYWTSVRNFEREARQALVNGQRHITEAELKRGRS